MSQSARGDLEKGSKANNAGLCYCRVDLSSPSFIINAYKIGGKQTQSAPNRPSRGEFSFGDSSGPLFTIYSKATEEEDMKMVKRWQKYADGVFIFVSPCVGIHIVSCLGWNTIDWVILCRSRCIPHCDHPGPETKQSGYLRILSWEHL
jgi:hypothetical protein